MHLNYCPNILFEEHQDHIPSEVNQSVASDEPPNEDQEIKPEALVSYGPLNENDMPEDDSLETLIKKLVMKVNTNELKQQELLRLDQRVENLESHIKDEVYWYLGEIKDQLEESKSSGMVMIKQEQVIEDQSKKIGHLEQQLLEMAD